MTAITIIVYGLIGTIYALAISLAIKVRQNGKLRKELQKQREEPE